MAADHHADVEAMAKLLTVFGATGQQGGSLIGYVLQNPKLSQSWRLRGITRDVTKPRAIALKEKGVELVEVWVLVNVGDDGLIGFFQADMNDRESLKKAVDGSYAVFAVTNCELAPIMNKNLHDEKFMLFS